MPAAASSPESTSAFGVLLVLALLLPATGAMAAFAAGRHHTQRIALATVAAAFAVATAVAGAVHDSGEALVYVVAGMAAPLGVVLRADGPAAAMMMTTGLVMAAIAHFARADFAMPAGAGEARAPFAFWILLLALWSALNAAFASGDLFALFVALELLTIAAVPLVSLDGRAETLTAALRYLLFALLGSVLYLAGTALLYGAYGTLDIALLATRVRPQTATWIAAALMTVGLVAKTALFPLHLWLPPAHAGAPPAASALLSALVIKGSFFITVRLWFDVMPAVPGAVAAQVLGALGAAAIVSGSVLALRQQRLKLLIAYSTVAQIGYLFLMFPLALGPDAVLARGGVALTGGIVQAVSHATAKAAMFMAAGLMAAAAGHDRIAGFSGLARHLPLTVLAFGLGGATLIGLPPSGGFLAKWLLLSAAASSGQWWWAIVILTGGLLSASYVAIVLRKALSAALEPQPPFVEVPRRRQAVVLALAIGAATLGLLAFLPGNPIDIGRGG